jgi:hypothetical protein
MTSARLKVLGIILLAIVMTLLVLTRVHGVESLLASVGWHGVASLGWNG